MKNQGSEVAQEPWDLVVKSSSSTGEGFGKNFTFDFREIGKYKDLLFLFVKRDFTTYYKQTILGPLWFFIQPALRVAIYYLIFARIAKIPTDGVPPILFYLSGIVFWEYFAGSWKKTADTFLENQHIFGKVYFPRIVVPISVLLSNGIKLGIQFLLFAAIWIYYTYSGFDVEVKPTLLLLPVFLAIIAMLALGSGLIVTAITTRYRDLKFLLDTAIQLLMYLSPILYPLSLATGVFRNILLVNPMTAVLEALRYSFLGRGVFSLPHLGYSLAFAAVLLLVGLVMFSRSEKNFIDTI